MGSKQNASCVHCAEKFSNKEIFLAHTHTRLSALCPRLPKWAGTRKVKPIWILQKQETVSDRQWHQLGHMQVCTSFQTDNHASTPPLCFLQAGCPSCRPTNSVKALKAGYTEQNVVVVVRCSNTGMQQRTSLLEKITFSYNRIFVQL